MQINLAVLPLYFIFLLDFNRDIRVGLEIKRTPFDGSTHVAKKVSISRDKG